MKHSNIKAIVFDFWGVFATFNAPVSAVIGLKGPVDKFNQDYYNLIKQHDLGQISEDEFLAATSKIFNVNLTTKHRYLFDDSDVNYKLIEIVKELKKKYKIGLISNTPRENTEQFLFKSGLDKLFDALILSYEVKFRKPDSRIYQLAVKKLGLKPEKILFIDDHQKSLDGAVEVGMQVLLYEGEKTNKILEELL